MLVVRCPKCKNEMKCNPGNIPAAKKRCVYCGHSFKLVQEKGNNILKRL